MIANYHTHTFRCGHAEGHEREYVEAALRAGLTTLGFSDHTPYDFFDSEPRDRPMRMKPGELPGYCDSIRALAAEYRARLEIPLGLEAEYYPKYFPRLLELLRENGVQYLILGQHFLGNEIGEPWNGHLTDNEASLDRYVGQAAEGLSTGLFSCLAHPDLIRFSGSDEVYARHMRRLCRAARDEGVPLEINLLGLRDGRNYPDPRFWRLAAEEGNAVILGCDAHTPSDLLAAGAEARALRLAADFGLSLLETLPLRRLDG
ncbi:MAG: histidinol-phosphatase [Oscillospiraceae bacterium]|nr:histidinol-phosphatase [Oscillospiraceae bacterium]